MYDYHLHSTNSADGRFTVDEICGEMVKKGFKEIAFTDHLDLDCPGGIDQLLDYQQYNRDIEDARRKYSGVLHIVMGMEIGLQPQVVERNREFVLKNKFDFIIGSVHHVDGLELFNGDFCRGKSREEAYCSYLKEVYCMVDRFRDFNVLGHIDVVRRFIGFEKRKIGVAEFTDVLEAILKKLVETERGIEVNSSGYRFGLEDTLPSVEVVRRFRELGGEIITVGSDGHRLNTFGFKIGESFRILQEAGFNHVCLYREGKPVFVDIP